MTISIKNNTASVNSLRYLGKAQDALGQSLERLSSGERINKGSDDPSGLIISENLRGQISGIQQAISNSEFSISMIQTAEGALTEVNNLLIEVRQLAVAAANEGANDMNSIAALQAQLSDALESIDRVSTQTRFGNKTLLDGSRGTIGVTNSDLIQFVNASANSKTSPVNGYDVNVTQLPTRTTATSALNNDLVEGLQLSLREGRNSVTVVAEEEETATSFIGKLQEVAKQAHLNVSIDYEPEAKMVAIQHQDFGSNPSFSITTSKAGVFGTQPGDKEYKNGTDVAGTIGTEAASGVGNVLTGNRGNRNTDGLSVVINGKTTGSQGSVSVMQNALVFQIGPNADQQLSLTLDNTGTSALARNVENESGYKNLSDINVTTSQGAQDSIKMVDKAISQMAGIRGKLGSFQKNALESNVASLQIAAENLIAAESSIRDTDIAYELAEYTKSRILTETSAASVAQAGDINKHSLMRLLRE
ncbi:flagellin [Deltaproteobacteria bacterium TL4]